jgi:hypothetical protein
MYSLAETAIVERAKIPSAALSFISLNKFQNCFALYSVPLSAWLLNHEAFRFRLK